VVFSYHAPTRHRHPACLDKAFRQRLTRPAATRLEGSANLQNCRSRTHFGFKYVSFANPSMSAERVGSILNRLSVKLLRWGYAQQELMNPNVLYDTPIHYAQTRA
jgi:hypothetical protein